MTQHWSWIVLTTLAMAGTASAQDRAVLGADRSEAPRTLSYSAQGERGTMQLRAEKMVSSQDANGNRSVNLSGMPGKLCNFRQQRGGTSEQWVEGEAQEISYDEDSGVIELSGNARLRQGQGSRATRQLSGERIRYDTLRDRVSATKRERGPSATLLISPPRPPEPFDEE